jgi:hypothetical protein
MSIETFEATEREREKEVRRRASTKRTRASRLQGGSDAEKEDEEELEQRGQATNFFEEKLPAKKLTKLNVKSDNKLPASSSTATATTTLKSKGSTLKSLFPRTAIPLDGDDADTTADATTPKPTKKTTKKARKSKGKAFKKRTSEDMLSSDLRDDEVEQGDKENATNLKSSVSSSSSIGGASGSLIKKRKLYTATTSSITSGKESQLSTPSLASSTGTRPLSQPVP